MIILNKEQVATVQAHLASAGLSESLSAELLDHLCCAIEARMEEGADFPTAVHTTLKSWPIRHLRGIQKNIRFTTKIKPMIFRFTTAAALLAGIVFMSPGFSPSPVAEVTTCTSHYNEEMLYSLTLPEKFEPPSASPIAGVEMEDILSCGYGMRTHPIFKVRKFHRGIDLKAKSGTPVLATADGKVIFAGSDGKYGITVRILHEDGYITVFAHLSEHIVDRGDHVILGEKIAAVGSTGMSTAPHLHYEVLKDDKPVDPLALGRALPAGATEG
ncbi:M23 family metallopeptidase [Neolewinella agarilytica]|uniref:M23 family metallopeptidase n=1 Tax=Neolewinella agarilytica TaxID=478744 RepID=UPI002354D4FD|nr:M23 family metallopeptidase [Neolewinella agarilytica]